MSKILNLTLAMFTDDLIRRPGSDFKGTWGAEDQHSTSISAPLETDDGTTSAPRSLQQGTLPAPLPAPATAPVSALASAPATAPDSAPTPSTDIHASPSTA